MLKIRADYSSPGRYKQNEDIIIGLSTIGKTILENLLGKGHHITIIDDKDKIENLVEKYDVSGAERGQDVIIPTGNRIKDK